MLERDARGRFVKGGPGGPGRPRGFDYLSVMRELLTPAEWGKIVRQAIKDAIAGQGEARRWLAEYVIGKPPQIIELKAAEAAQLAELLRLMESQGHSASDVFAAMLQEIALTADDDRATQ